MNGADLARADEAGFRAAVEPWRREILAHCYRICGSLSEAEDLVQDTFLRAWQARATFGGRSSVRRWLHRIASNAAIDTLRQRRRRGVPQRDGGPPGDAAQPLPAPVAEPIWLEPYPDALLPDDAASPDARYSQRQSVELAFVVALQALTPQQRAVLLLRDVLGYDAAEVAEQLDLTVAAVNGSLLRARAALPDVATDAGGVDVDALVGRYVDAFQRRDLDTLVGLLRDDAVLSMPPIPSWYAGAEAVVRVLAGSVLLSGTELAMRPVQVSGGPGMAGWARPPGGAWSPLGVQALTVRDGRIAEITCFVGPAFHRWFGLGDTP